MRSPPRIRFRLVCTSMTMAAAVILQAIAAAANERAPRALEILPAEVELFGPGSQQQVLVAADYGPDGLADVTAAATFETTAPVVALATTGGIVVPRGDGQTQLVVRYQGLEARLPVRVRQFATPPLVDFRMDVIAALSKGGC